MDPILGIRGKGLLKIAVGVLGAIALFAAITMTRVVNIPFVGKYAIVLPTLPLVLALVGALEAWTGQPLAVWSARFESLTGVTRLAIAVFTAILVIIGVVLVLAWKRGQ